MNVVLLFSLLPACGPDISVSKIAVDADNDGYESTVDCDDAAKSIHPEADEVCDGVDNDCDGDIDEDAVDALTRYTDADGDGHGAPETPTIGCEDQGAPVGDDCDDADASVHPDAAEHCNELDDDCDGKVDEDATDATTTWADADGDGYGDPGTSSTGCSSPPGNVSDFTDCDDAAAAVHPGADEADCTDPVDYNCDGAVEWADDDGDGWAVCEDCNDENVGINPAAVETCNGVDDDCDGLVDDESAADARTWYRDVDGDAAGDDDATAIACDAPAGYVATRGDCNDQNTAINPGESEVCDTLDLDEDCSGTADDEDAYVDASTFSTFAPDVDGDSYGDAAGAVTGCDAPAGYVADATDCDDSDAEVSPAGSEVCNGLDDDCDTRIDDDDPSLAGATTWYTDADADGYGGSTTTSACDAPAGFVAPGNDCDETDAAINPGASEVCDAVDADEDCSGLADDGDPGTDAATFSTFARDADGDSYGDPAHTATQCEIPAGYVVDRTDCDDTSATIHPGGAEVAGNGVDEDCDGLDDPLYTGWGSSTVSLADADTTFLGANASDAVGYALAVTDLNGDGLGDVIAGTRNVDLRASADGGAFIFYGGAHSGEEPMTDADEIIPGEAGSDAAGTQIYATGDVDGDGFGDVLVGAHFNDGNGANAGRAYLFTGAEISGMTDLGDASFVFTGEAAGDYFGYYLSGAGDVDGDGLGDVLVGASFRDEAGADAGKAYLFLADSVAGGGEFAASSADYTILGATAGDYLGEDCAPAGDVDGDGRDDFMLGATQVNDAGAAATGAGEVFLFFGGGLGSTQALLTSNADVTFTGSASGDAFGQAIGHGDFDGDLRSDVVVSAYQSDSGGTNAGAAYVFLAADVGSASTVNTSDAAVSVLGDAASDELGTRTLLGVDIDLDGADDLLAGAHRSDTSAADGGIAALFLSSNLLSSTSLRLADADVRFLAEDAGDDAGAALAAGDLDGDTVPDLVIGAHHRDDLVTDGGAIYLMLTP